MADSKPKTQPRTNEVLSSIAGAIRAVATDEAVFAAYTGWSVPSPGKVVRYEVAVTTLDQLFGRRKE